MIWEYLYFWKYPYIYHESIYRHDIVYSYIISLQHDQGQRAAWYCGWILLVGPFLSLLFQHSWVERIWGSWQSRWDKNPHHFFFEWKNLTQLVNQWLFFFLTVCSWVFFAVGRILLCAFLPDDVQAIRRRPHVEPTRDPENFTQGKGATLRLAQVEVNGLRANREWRRSTQEFVAVFVVEIGFCFFFFVVVVYTVVSSWRRIIEYAIEWLPTFLWWWRLRRLCLQI